MGRGDAAAATWIESEVRKRKIRKTPRQKKPTKTHACSPAAGGGDAFALATSARNGDWEYIDEQQMHATSAATPERELRGR